MPSMLYLILAAFVGLILGGLKLSSWYRSPKQQVKRAAKKVVKAKIILELTEEKSMKANEKLFKLIESLAISKHLSASSPSINVTDSDASVTSDGMPDSTSK